MSQPKRGLGRGLSALISSQTLPSPAARGGEGDSEGGRRSRIQEVALSAISPNPRQPRQVFEPEHLQELADSIRVHGLIQPLVVTRSTDTPEERFYLIAGERRWRASGLAGLTAVPVVIKEATPQQMLELALVENIQRADLNPLEEAAAYRTLMDEFGLTQERVAERVGKSRSAVANSVRLLGLPETVRGGLAGGLISEGHARALLKPELSDESILRIYQAIVDRGLTVRQAEELARRALVEQAAPATAATVHVEFEAHTPLPDTRWLEERFTRALETRVTLNRGRKGGRVVIEFDSEEDLQRIYDAIIGPEA